MAYQACRQTICEEALVCMSGCPGSIGWGMPDIDVTSSCPHAHTSNEAALDELVRVMPHDLSVLAGARL